VPPTRNPNIMNNPSAPFWDSPKTAPEAPFWSSPFGQVKMRPTKTPTLVPSFSLVPSSSPPTSSPTKVPTNAPTSPPTSPPTEPPTEKHSTEPSAPPTPVPSPEPSFWPTPSPSVVPTPTPSLLPSPSPSLMPTPSPSVVPTPIPSVLPSTEPSVIPTPSPSQFPTEPICPDNLGDNLSGGTGNNTVNPYPNIEFSDKAKGNDDSASVLICGDLDIVKGAEVEGKIVTIGSMRIHTNSDFSSMVRAGWGSHVVPNDGTDAVIVAEDLTINVSDTTFMHPGYGNIIHKGNFHGEVPQEVQVGIPPGYYSQRGLSKYDDSSLFSDHSSVSDVRRLQDAGFSYIFQDSDYDMTEWLEACSDIENKGPHWAYNLAPNCIVEGIDTNTITFKAVDADPLQVCHIRCEDLTFYVGRHIKFDSSMDDRTILINVKADNDGICDICNLADFFDTSGKGHFEFSTAFISNILWNFYDAKEVSLGCNECTANGEWRGSIIVPQKDSLLNFCFPGHSGRLIVNGDMVQNKTGSELHNFPFDPPERPPCPPEPPSETPN